jgi:hypothetical protein
MTPDALDCAEAQRGIEAYVAGDLQPDFKMAARTAAPPVPSVGRRRPRILRPAALAATLLAALALGWWQSSRPAPGPTPGQIARAEREARYALALVARIGRKAGSELRDDVLIDRVAIPVLDSVGRSLNRVPAATGDEAASEGGVTS